MSKDNNSPKVEDMSKEELINVINGLMDKVEDLTTKLETKGTGRKEAVLKLLMEGATSITSIAGTLGITNKNVSSQLSYLRKEGHTIISYRLNNESHLELR